MRTIKFKLVFKIFLIASLCFILCACHADGTGSDVAEKTPQSVHEMPAQAYVPVITENDLENAAFSLIYLDDDDIPELVILDRDCYKYSIYTIKESSIECLVDSITTVELTYFERKNIISAFYRSKGGGEEGEFASAYYELNQYYQAVTDNSIPSFSFAYHAVYDETGQWTGAGTTDYYEKGKKIDETAYNEMFVALDISQSDDVSCFSKDNKCFTRDEILMYLGTETTKTPEQVLEEQLIDDTHDAFLVDTGGGLGTLLVTAELDEDTPTEVCRATVQFTVWNPDSMYEPLQTFTAGTDIFLDWSIIDANFDGYMDFTCTYLRGNQPYYDHLWIWNEEHGRFEGVPEYDEISVPCLDAETKTIYGFNRSSGAGTGLQTFHQWAEGNLLCMRCIEIESTDQQNTFRMSIQDRIAGELVEIYHEDFSFESGGWLDAQMVWYDLNYHGELE